MSNNGDESRRDRKSIMKGIKKSSFFNRISSKSKNKNKVSPAPSPRSSDKNNTLQLWSDNQSFSMSDNAMLAQVDGSALSNTNGTPSASTTRKSSFIPFISKDNNHSNNNPNTASNAYYSRGSMSHSKSANLHPFDSPFDIQTAKKKGHRKNESIGLGLNGNAKKVTQKLKSSKYSLPFTSPTLYLNKRPAMYKSVAYDGDEFNHLLSSNNDGIIDRLVIAINIDIEQVYNEEYDNNYNRKLLGPLKPVRFPVVIECPPEQDDDKYDDDQFGHLESDSDYVFSSSDEDFEDLAMDLKDAKPLQIIATRSTQNFRAKSASLVCTIYTHTLLMYIVFLSLHIAPWII